MANSNICRTTFFNLFFIFIFFTFFTFFNLFHFFCKTIFSITAPQQAFSSCINFLVFSFSFSCSFSFSFYFSFSFSFPFLFSFFFFISFSFSVSSPSFFISPPKRLSLDMEKPKSSNPRKPNARGKNQNTCSLFYSCNII